MGKGNRRPIERRIEENQWRGELEEVSQVYSMFNTRTRRSKLHNLVILFFVLENLAPSM